MPRSALLFIFMATLALSGGCATPRIDLAVASHSNVNPDHSGRPSPVIVKIYEMRSDLAFKQSDFIPLFMTPVQVLGADLLAVDELVLVPGEARRITYEPAEKTRFLGILAGFRQMERAAWKTVTPIDSGTENTVGIELTDTTLALVAADTAAGWDPAEAVKSFQKSAEAADTGSGDLGYYLPEPKRLAQ